MEDHDLRHTGRRWICVDEVLDRIAPVIRIRVPAGRNALSQAVAQSAKSASRVKLVLVTVSSTKTSRSGSNSA